MRKTGLVIVLLLLFATVSGAAVTDDKEFRTGLKYYNSKNYKAAVKQFREYVDSKPDPAAYYLLGYSLYKLGRFGEADEYFSQAYFIDPEFSLEKAGLIKKPSGEVAPEKPALKKAPLKTPAIKTAESAEKQPAPVAKKILPSSPSPVAPANQKQKASGPVSAPAATPKQIVPRQTAPSPMPAPSTPVVKPLQMPKQIPGAAAPLLVGIMAAFGMFFFIIVIAFYVFVSLCLFLIAKKLNVPAPWTAWIPIVNIWTLVACAGQPAWWLIFCFIPIVNFFVFIYLYMCITENLGNNKWLGLLMLVPLVNLGFLGWLAFSKSESYGIPAME
jgi:hypothetical protein